MNNTDELLITVPQRLAFESLHTLLAQVPTVAWEYGVEHVDLSVDLSQLQFTRPTGLSCLAALVLYLIRQAATANVKFVRPTDPSADQYLSRMNFYQIFEVEIAEFFQRHAAAGRFRELIELTHEEMCRNVAGEVCKILEEKISLSPELSSALEYVLSEVSENVFHHANSPIHGIVCAQSYPAEKSVEIAIVDCGCGVSESLRRNPELTGKIQSPTDGVSWAIKRRITGRPDHNSGEGLFWSSEFVRRGKGRFSLWSDTGRLLIADSRQLVEEVPRWGGTLITLTMRHDADLNLDDLFNELAPPDQDFELSMAE